jgi:hypothetical protein
MPAAGGNHPIGTPVRRAPLKIGTTTATDAVGARLLTEAGPDAIIRYGSTLALKGP